MPLLSWLSLASLQNRLVPLGKPFSSKDKSHNGVLLAIGCELYHFIHGEIMRERGITRMFLSPEGLGEDHGHSGHIA